MTDGPRPEPTPTDPGIPEPSTPAVTRPDDRQGPTDVADRTVDDHDRRTSRPPEDDDDRWLPM